MQTLAALMGTATAKISAEGVATVEKKPTFFEQNKAKILTGQAEREYASARAMAKGYTQDFMKAVHDSNHKDHVANLAAYRNDFGMDMSRVERKYLDKFSSDLGSPNPEDLKENPAYEHALNEKYRPKGEKVSADSLAFFNILQANLKASRDKRGYGPQRCYDQMVVQDWMTKYGQS